MGLAQRPFGPPPQEIIMYDMSKLSIQLEDEFMFLKEHYKIVKK